MQEYADVHCSVGYGPFPQKLSSVVARLASTDYQGIGRHPEFAKWTEVVMGKHVCAIRHREQDKR